MKGQACRSCALSCRKVSHLGPLTAEVYGGSGGLVQLHRGEDNEDVLIQFWQCILQEGEGEGLSGLVLIEDDAAAGGEIVSASCGDVAVVRVRVCVCVCVCVCACVCVQVYIFICAGASTSTLKFQSAKKTRIKSSAHEYNT